MGEAGNCDEPENCVTTVPLCYFTNAHDTGIVLKPNVFFLSLDHFGEAFHYNSFLSLSQFSNIWRAVIPFCFFMTPPKRLYLKTSSCVLDRNTLYTCCGLDFYTAVSVVISVTIHTWLNPVRDVWFTSIEKRLRGRHWIKKLFYFHFYFISLPYTSVLHFYIPYTCENS